MDQQKNDDQNVGANITLNNEGNEGNKLSTPCGEVNNDGKNAEHGRENPNPQNTDHNYINHFITNTNAVPTSTGGIDPTMKALIDQNQVLINSLLTMNLRLQERDKTPPYGPEYTVMPNFLNTLPEFDGRGDKQSAEDWLAAIEEFQNCTVGQMFSKWKLRVLR